MTTIDWTRVALDAETGYVARIDIEARGIRCGGSGFPHRHSNVDEVKACYAETEEMRLEAEAERYAEDGLVRFLENQGSCSGIPNYSDPQGGSCLCC